MTNKIQKTILKARYIDLELQEVREVFEKCKSEWNSYVARVTAEVKPGQPAKTCPMDQKQKNNKIKHKSKKSQPGVIKQMYRDIAKQVHPDKNIGSEEDMERFMRQASRAKENGDMISLMNMCDDLGIKTPKLRQSHIKYVEQDISNKEKQIKQMKLSDAWIWYHSDDNKKQLIHKILVDSLTK